MKEWVGEWEYKTIPLSTKHLSIVKTGSPKLNSNWTLKIK
jgi:hypothetical protein